MKKIFYICALVIFNYTASSQSSSVSNHLSQLIQFKLDSLQRANGFPGVTFAAVLPNNDKLVLASGLADSLKNRPMTPDSRMLSGSNGKTFFIASALMLESKGVFDLDDPIEKYIGEETWFKKIPNASDITMRMLMNHTSGIEEYYPLGDFMDKVKEDPSRRWAPVETLSYVFDKKPLFPAGEKWGYADTNYILLSYIIEKISDREMYDLIEEHILKPHNLEYTEPSVKRHFEKLAVGYSGTQSPFPFQGPMVIRDSLVFNPQFEWAGGGFVSNVQDLAMWAKTIYDFDAISADNLRAMKAGIPAATGQGHLYGLGLQIRPAKDVGYSYGHSGWFPGYITDAAYFPDFDLALSIQFNTDDFKYLKLSPYNYLVELANLINMNLNPNKFRG